MLCIRGTSHGPVSVRPSVTSRSSTKTAKRRITQTTPHDSPGTLVSEAKDLREIRPGSPPTGAPNAGERGVVRVRRTVLEFYTPCNFSATANARDFKFCTRVGHAES